MKKTLEAVGSNSRIRVSTEPYGVYLEVGNLDEFFSDNDGYVSLTKEEAQRLIEMLQEAVDA